MESRKLRTFKNTNQVVIASLKDVPHLRKGVVNTVVLLVESSKMEEDFRNNPLATNIYQHTWRKAYAKMSSCVGVDPYEALEIDTDEDIKLASIENMGLLPELLVTLSSLS